MIALRNPQAYRSASAFAPICNPIDVPWGEKAFGNYLGPDRSRWAEWDASELLKQGSRFPLRCHQIGCPEAFSKPTVDGLEAGDCVGRLALLMQEAGKARRRAQFQDSACWRRASSSACLKRSFMGQVSLGVIFF